MLKDAGIRNVFDGVATQVLENPRIMVLPMVRVMSQIADRSNAFRFPQDITDWIQVECKIMHFQWDKPSLGNGTLTDWRETIL